MMETVAKIRQKISTMMRMELETIMMSVQKAQLVGFRLLKMTKTKMAVKTKILMAMESLISWTSALIFSMIRQI